jgi:hypothetical protein
LNLDALEEMKEGSKTLGALDCIQTNQIHQVSTDKENI